MKTLKKLMIVFTFTLLFVLTLIFWGAYEETQLQYTTYQEFYSKNMECRAAIGNKGDLNGYQYADRICGPIPTWNDVVYEVEG